MSPRGLIQVMSMCGVLLIPAADGAQAADGSPTAPALPHAAPATRVRAVRPDSTLPDAKLKALPKPTAAERADKRKLDHDLKICIGC